jgi:hypothetical protein
VRIISAVGAALFVYLAVIPAGLIFATLDSACAGPACETSVLSRIVFTLVYAACAVAILATAGLLARYTALGTPEVQRQLPRALAVTGFAIGGCAFLLFALAEPAGGLVAAALGGGTYLAVVTRGRRA